MCPLTEKDLLFYLENRLEPSERNRVHKVILENHQCQKQLEKLKKKKKKNEAKDNMLPHSEAKVDMLISYLGRYLAILTRINFISRINIYDIFCGRGFYKNGKEGSPIRAFKAIRETQLKLINQEKSLPLIHLILNDENKDYVKIIKEYIDIENEPSTLKCHPEYYSISAHELFPRIIKEINSKGRNEKNLIFIDPYGYKEIRKFDLVELLKKGNTEVVLFLPISTMHRFKVAAVQDEENVSFQKLKRFIDEFFGQKHPIKLGEDISIFQFIDFIKQALTFNETYYTSSFYLERDNKKNIYALFFITPNEKGIEKILEAKWEMDNEKGAGFKLSSVSNQMGFFSQEVYRNVFQEKLKIFLKEKDRTNIDVRSFALKNEHLPKHANQVLRELKNQKKIKIFNIGTSIENRRGLYTSENKIKVYFKYGK